MASLAESFERVVLMLTHPRTKDKNYKSLAVLDLFTFFCFFLLSIVIELKNVTIPNQSININSPL